ncbi:MULTISPECIES: prohibitin family protein [Shewanella]|jgi:regulator of protease activity HflC (stomatin/prohibitin superfamily)|uniref:prohibitin family protein n=1 Tax=Shewanella TaxID=22 RepID=UPI001676BDEF|nr:MULTISPECIES: prohibitin family protein [Shewanella]MBO1272994.1 prohibitin family protein [Shewanella sp. 4t3-1-2LB]MCL2906875.1 prohibitin family protein [Shewanella fodinae]GGZ04188.1 negative regulator of univalent cation permeability [Shewanella fodinae]
MAIQYSTPANFSVAKLVPLLVIILLVVIGFGSWFTVDQGERGVHLRNGKVIGTAEPGMGFKLPMFDKIVKISTQTHTVSYPKLQAYSRDQQPATIRVSVTFRVPEDKVTEVYAEFKSIDGMVDRLVDRQVPTQIENIFGQYTAISAVQERVKFVMDINQALKNSVHGPIDITSVQVENIDFSNAYEKSVEDRMRAEVEVQTQKQNLEKERVSAQIAVTKAQAEADSQLARAKAEAEAIRIKGEAEASAIKSRADALAKNKDLIELTKAEKWDGKLPSTMLPNSTLPFFETNK